MTKGIKISINHKRELYLSSKYSNNAKLNPYPANVENMVSS